MKIIFLDIDGVLNSQLWYTKRRNYNHTEISKHYPYYEFDPDAISQLNRIVKETNAKIVISSTWRIGRTIEELQDILNNVGFEGDVIDITISFGGIKGYTIPRGCEIEHWLESKNFQRINWSKEVQSDYIEKSGVSNYIILDDDSDMLYEQREHFIQTTNNTGLDKKIADKAIDTLNKSLIDLYY